MGRIIVFTGPGCRHCAAAKALLAAAGVPFHEVDVTCGGGGGDRIMELRALAGTTSVPQVFLNDELLRGGLTTLRAWQAGGELVTRLRACLDAPPPDEPRVLTADEWRAVSGGGVPSPAAAAAVPGGSGGDHDDDHDDDRAAGGYAMPPSEFWRGVRLLQTFLGDAAAPAPAAAASSSAASSAGDGARLLAPVATTPPWHVVARDAGAAGWALPGAVTPSPPPLAAECRLPLEVTFRGAELVSWLTRHLAVTRPDALALCVRLHATGVVAAVDFAARHFEDSAALYTASLCGDVADDGESSGGVGGGGGDDAADGGGGGRTGAGTGTGVQPAPAVAAFEIEAGGAAAAAAAAAPLTRRRGTSAHRTSSTAAILAAFLAPAPLPPAGGSSDDAAGNRGDRFSSDGGGSDGTGGSGDGTPPAAPVPGATLPPAAVPPPAAAAAMASAGGMLLLNAGSVYAVPPGAAPRHAADVGRDLRRRMLALYARFLSHDGTYVDYAALRDSPLLAEYVAATAELQAVNAFLLTPPERKAFFINLYNALVIHATVVVGAPATSWARSRFFQRIGYRIGPYALSLDDMEHGILRANRKHPYQLAPRFARGDPRLPLALPSLDPRIHFALVCGARSCPPVQLYSAANVERALTLAAEAFLSDAANFDVALDGVRVSPAVTPAAAVRARVATVTLSKLFAWYASDFGAGTHAALLWMVPFLPPAAGDLLSAILGAPRVADCTLEASDAATLTRAAGGAAAAPPTPPAPAPPAPAAKEKIVSELAALFPTAATLAALSPRAPLPPTARTAAAAASASSAAAAATVAAATAAQPTATPDTSFRGIGGPLLPRVVVTYADYDWSPNGSAAAAPGGAPAATQNTT